MWGYRAGFVGLRAVPLVGVGRTWRSWQVDPVSASIALAALALSIWAGRLAAFAQRVADTDVVAWADRLADAVTTAETRQRQQMLASALQPIDVGFTMI